VAFNSVGRSKGVYLMDNVTELPTGNMRELKLIKKYMSVINDAMNASDFETAAEASERLMTMLNKAAQGPSGCVRRSKRGLEGITRASLFIESYAELTDGQSISLNENITELMIDLMHLQERHSDTESAFNLLDEARIGFIVS